MGGLSHHDGSQATSERERERRLGGSVLDYLLCSVRQAWQGNRGCH